MSYARKTRVVKSKCETPMRKKDELTDFVGSSYSERQGISYREVSKEEAWELWIDGKTIWFNIARSLDTFWSPMKMSREIFQKILHFDSRDFSFNDCVRMVKEQFHYDSHHNVPLHYFVEI